MTLASLNQFINGAIMMGFAIAGLFFLRFHRETGDRLFAIFAGAFWALSLNRIFLAFTAEGDELRTLFYFIRLVAFTLILIAIIDKNRSR